MEFSQKVNFCGSLLALWTLMYDMLQDALNILEVKSLKWNSVRKFIFGTTFLPLLLRCPETLKKAMASTSLAKGRMDGRLKGCKPNITPQPIKKILIPQ